MPRIAILPDTLASQVAAGEVVERPSSVLKELIENALDAGATQIEVEVRKGGAALMRIIDNGHGMDRENALMSLERHATSKLQDSEGLNAIMTHGFRGEALPSIASVGRFRLMTNHDAKCAGTEVVVEGGKVLGVNEIARAKGTTIEVKDLFYNVPARKKFLKSESTEYAHVEHAVKLSALGNAGVRYIFKNNGRLVWDLKPTSDRRIRIGDLAGQSVMSQLITLEKYTLGEISVEGYILPGRLSRGSGKSQTVFINGRPIDDPVIRGAIKDGYQGHIQQGQFPVVWLWLQMPPELIDVNVHPAKREVRFAKPSEVKHVLSEAIASTLSPKARPAVVAPAFVNPTPAREVPVAKPSSISGGNPFKPLAETSNDSEKEQSGPTKAPFRLAQEWSTPDQEELDLASRGEGQSSAEKDSKSSDSGFKFIGGLKGRFWLLEDDTGLVVLDPKAARSRICYEQLRQAHLEQALSSQALLIPLLLELDGHDHVVLESHLDTLQDLGVEISSFGGNTFQVQSLPALLELSESGDAEHFVLGVIDQLAAHSAPKSLKAREKTVEHLLVSMAEQSALNQSLDPQFALSLVAELMLCELPYCTALGKPTMIHYAESEIAKRF